MLKDGIVKLFKKPKYVEVVLKDYDFEGSAENINETGLKKRQLRRLCRNTIEKKI